MKPRTCVKHKSSKATQCWGIYLNQTILPIIEHRIYLHSFFSPVAYWYCLHSTCLGATLLSFLSLFRQVTIVQYLHPKFLHRHSDFENPSQVAHPCHREGMDHAQLAQRLLQISESSCGLSEYLLRRLKDFMRSRRDESGTRMK